MDKIQRFLNNLSPKEKLRIKDILIRINLQNFKGLDLKKLKGRSDIFKIRKGKLRIIFRKRDNKIFILTIEKRNDNTY